MSDWKFTWFTNWDKIMSDDFMSRWQQWIDNADDPHVFYHPVMGKIWIETYLPLRKIQPLFCLAEQEDMKIFMPLVMWRRNWKNAFLKHIIPLGYSDYDYNDSLVIGGPGWKDIDQFWEKLIADLKKKNPDKIEITGIRGGRVSGLHNWVKDVICPYIRIDGYLDANDYVDKNFSKNSISELKRRKRRLLELGNYNFTTYAHTTICEAVLELSDFLETHNQRWPNAYKPPGYHRRLLQVGLKSGLVHFSVLKLSGVSISWRLGFIFRHRFYSYMPAFKTEYRKYGIGKLHLLYCIEQAMKNNCDIFDQLRGQEEYKNDFQSGYTTLIKYNIDFSSMKSNLKTTAVRLKKKVVK